MSIFEKWLEDASIDQKNQLISILDTPKLVEVINAMPKDGKEKILESINTLSHSINEQVEEIKNVFKDTYMLSPHEFGLDGYISNIHFKPLIMKSGNEVYLQCSYDIHAKYYDEMIHNEETFFFVINSLNTKQDNTISQFKKTLAKKIRQEWEPVIIATTIADKKCKFFLSNNLNNVHSYTRESGTRISLNSRDEIKRILTNMEANVGDEDYSHFLNRFLSGYKTLFRDSVCTAGSYLFFDFPKNFSFDPPKRYFCIGTKGKFSLIRDDEEKTKVSLIFDLTK